MILGRTLEIDEHHDEQVQHDDAARVDQHLDHGEELRGEQHVEGGDSEEIQHQEQHGVHRVPRGHHEHREAEYQRRDDVERDRVVHQNRTFMIPVATMFAIATGIRTFQPSRISWSYRYRGSVARTQRKT